MKTLEQLTQEAAEKSASKLVGLAPELQIEKFISGAEWERNREKWISVEDVLPEDHPQALGMSLDVWTANIPTKEMREGHFYKPSNEWHDVYGNFIEVTHWQPMPQIPKK